MQSIPLPKQVAFLISDVARLLRRRFDHRAQSLGLTRAQWQVLTYVGRNEGTNQVGLAEFMEVEPITLSRHIDRMQAAGLVERRPDPADRRAYRLYLTDKGRPLLDQLRSLGGCVMDEVFAGVSKEDTERLVDTLLVMRGNLSSRQEDATDERKVAS